MPVTEAIINEKSEARAARPTLKNCHSVRDPDGAIIKNLMRNSETLKHACMDIDGVLCRDPTGHEDDDGERYEHFLANAQPLLSCSCWIGTLVTNRLEKYRPQTEEWLARQGIRYGNLVMRPEASQADLRRAAHHGKFKADIYIRRKRSPIFIESSLGQAREIANLSGKMVYCVDSGELIYTAGVSGIRKLVATLGMTRGGRILAAFIPVRIKRFIRGETAPKPETV